MDGSEDSDYNTALSEEDPAPRPHSLPEDVVDRLASFPEPGVAVGSTDTAADA